MFEVGFPELVLIAIIGLLVIGPERLPEALRTLGLWFGRMRRSFVSVKAEIEKEIGMDEVKRQLHNEAIMDEMKRIEQEVKGTVDTARSALNEGAAAVDMPKIDPNVHTDVADMVAAQDSIGSPELETPDPETAAESATPEASSEASDNETTTTEVDDRNAAADDRNHADAAEQPDAADDSRLVSRNSEEPSTGERVKSG